MRPTPVDPESLFEALCTSPGFLEQYKRFCDILQVDPDDTLLIEDVDDDRVHQAASFLLEETLTQTDALAHLLYLRGQCNYSSPKWKADFVSKWLETIEEILNRPACSALDIAVCAHVIAQVLTSKKDIDDRSSAKKFAMRLKEDGVMTKLLFRTSRLSDEPLAAEKVLKAISRYIYLHETGSLVQDAMDPADVANHLPLIQPVVEKHLPLLASWYLDVTSRCCQEKYAGVRLAARMTERCRREEGKLRRLANDALATCQSHTKRDCYRRRVIEDAQRYIGFALRRQRQCTPAAAGAAPVIGGQ